MVSFTLLKGGRYRARVILNWVESFAGNDTVADKFRSIGFSDITVRGSGAQRIIEGDWMNDTVVGEMPSQIDAVIVVSEPPVVEKKEKIVVLDKCTCIEGSSKPGPIHMDGCPLCTFVWYKRTWVWYDPRTWF